MSVEKRQREIIEYLVKERKKQGFSQAELGDASGIMQPVIARMEKGHTVPRLDTILKCLDSMGLTLAIEKDTTGDMPTAEKQEKPNVLYFLYCRKSHSFFSGMSMSPSKGLIIKSSRKTFMPFLSREAARTTLDYISSFTDDVYEVKGRSYDEDKDGCGINEGYSRKLPWKDEYKGVIKKLKA